AFKLAVVGAFLSSYTSPLAMITGSIPADSHSRHSTVVSPEKGYFSTERIFISVVFRHQMFDVARDPHTGYFHKRPIIYTQVIGIGVRRVELGWETHAPSFVGIDGFFHVVIILAF